jgi:hypothetical protein
MRYSRLVAVAAMGCLGSFGALALDADKVHAIAITVGGVAIADGGARDLDGAANNSITFNSAAGGAAGFAVPQGYVVSGITRPTVQGGFWWVTLTNFTCTRPGAGAVGGAMPINVSHVFANVPAGPGIVRWFGAHSNPAGIKGATSTLICKVNGANIGVGLLTEGPIVGGVAKNFNINTGPTPFAAGNWTVTSDFTIDLGPGDSAIFPNSADFGNVDPLAVSLPGVSPWGVAGLCVMLLGFGLAVVRNRRTAAA